jgi:hypothetical protein
VFDEELAQLEALVRQLAAAGVDAVIVQVRLHNNNTAGAGSAVSQCAWLYGGEAAAGCAVCA